MASLEGRGLHYAAVVQKNSDFAAPAPDGSIVGIADSEFFAGVAPACKAAAVYPMEALRTE